MNNNPYMKKASEVKLPILTRLPIHDFIDNASMEEGLLPFELVVARIPNRQPAGFIHHVGLVYKDGEGKVYSLMMTQHQGELKDTQENLEFLQKISGEENGKSAEKFGNTGPEASAIPGIDKGPEGISL